MGIEPYSSSEYRTNEQDRRLFATNVEKLIEDANKMWGELYLSVIAMAYPVLIGFTILPTLWKLPSGIHGKHTIHTYKRVYYA